MRLATRGLRGVLHPKPGDKSWVDVLMLTIFGLWFLAGIISLLPSGSDGNACDGPGFADFGCTGGREAVIGNMVFGLFVTFLFSVAAVALLRLINRRRD